MTEQTINKEEVAEIRKRNLLFLIEQYGSLAKLNAVLGRKRADSSLAQIKNSSFNKATRTLRKMGVGLAREIESKLNLPIGWMDISHPEVFPLPEVSIGKAINKQVGTKRKNTSQTLTIPLFQLEKIESGNSSNPILIGEIELPDAFIKVLPKISEIKEDSLKAFYITDSSLQTTFPLGSIAVFDTRIKKFLKDGIYLLRIGNNLVMRKIVISARGGYFVTTELNEPEYLENLDKVDIIGFAIGGWKPIVL